MRQRQRQRDDRVQPQRGRVVAAVDEADLAAQALADLPADRQAEAAAGAAARGAA